jgi:hypothetical protein
MSVVSGPEPIDPDRRKRQAYVRGWFDHEHELVDTGLSREDVDLRDVTSSALWRNSILPDLRAMAGYVDDGYGNYDGLEGDVRVIVDGAEVSKSRREFAPALLDELVGSYFQGAEDGAFAPVDVDMLPFAP